MALSAGFGRKRHDKWLWAAVLSALALAGSASTAAGAPTVPLAFRGEWNADLKACGTDLNDSRLIVSGRKLTFYESAGPPVRVVEHSRREIELLVRLRGEGEGPWVQSFRLRLMDHGMKLVDVSHAQPFGRSRCPPAAPERQ
jgi:hypothetical protein